MLERAHRARWGEWSNGRSTAEQPAWLVAAVEAYEDALAEALRPRKGVGGDDL